MRLNDSGKARVMGWADTIAWIFAKEHIDTLCKINGKELKVEDIVENITEKVKYIIDQDLIHPTYIEGRGIKVEYTHYNNQEPSIGILIVPYTPSIYLDEENHFEEEIEEGLFEEEGDDDS